MMLIRCLYSPDKKLIIVNDDLFDSNNSKIIESYLSKENESTILIFIFKNRKTR